MPKGSISHVLRRDTGDHDAPRVKSPYHYIRTETYDAHHDLLLVGGEDHKTAQANVEHIAEHRRYDALIAWTKRHFSGINDIIYKRS